MKNSRWKDLGQSSFFKFGLRINVFNNLYYYIQILITKVADEGASGLGTVESFFKVKFSLPLHVSGLTLRITYVMIVTMKLYVYHVPEFDDSKVSYMSRGRAWNCTLYRGRGELRVCSCSCISKRNFLVWKLKNKSSVILSLIWSQVCNLVATVSTLTSLAALWIHTHSIFIQQQQQQHLSLFVFVNSNESHGFNIIAQLNFSFT